MGSGGASADISRYYESVCYEKAVKADKSEKVGLVLKRSNVWDTLYISGIKKSSKFANSKLKVGMVIVTINGIKCPKTVKEIQKVMKETKGELTVMAATISKEISLEDDNGPALLPPEKARTEEYIRNKYVKQLAGVVLVKGPIIGWTLYLINRALISEGSKAIMDAKFEFLQEYQLYYLYMAIFIIYLTRLPLVVNSNGARSPTCLDRPDQHIYQVVGTKQLVLMATDGANGRFNRAQRGMYNMDESLPQFLANTLLVAPILGTIVCFLLLPMYAYGRVSFAHAYKADKSTRSHGFLFSMIAEHGMAALVGVIAIKAAFWDDISVESVVEETVLELRHRMQEILNTIAL